MASFRARISVLGTTILASSALVCSFAPTAAAAGDSGTTTTVVRYSSNDDHILDGACEMKSDTPHWSTGARSVIFKTRVECIGTETPTVRITGRLNHNPDGLPLLPSDGPLTTVHTSVQDQVVPIGKTVTFYTPLKDTDKITEAGTYQGSAVGEIVSPVHSNLNEFNTARTYVLPLL